MKMKFVSVYILSDHTSTTTKAASEGLVNTSHIRNIVEQPANDDDKISFGLRFKNKKMIDTVCELQLVNDMWVRVPYTKAQFLKMYEKA